MKKTILSFLLLSTLAVSSLAAKSSDSEYKIEISDKITIGSSRAYECVATIAHLAGFPEFNIRQYSDDFANYDEYFKKYLNNQDVARAILYFQKLRQENQFAYDSVASIGTYLSDDCHSFRTSYKNVKKYLEPISEFNDYDEVIEEDNRTFCEYYKERIADNQMIISTFFVSEDIKPKSIKIAIFILTIDLYILLNGLFYSDSYISRVFNSTEKETFFSFIPRSIDRFIYSTMAGNIIEYIIKFLIVEEITIHKLLFKKRDTKRSLKYDMSGLLKSILNKIKVLIILSYIIIIFSWYYISCFNNAYPNIKIEWIISSIFIIIFIQILPFIFCFFETCLRFLSIKIKSEKLFKLSLLFP